MYNRHLNGTSNMYGNQTNQWNNTDFRNQHTSNAVSKKPTIRIMGRDYPLTATAYKHLIIGICIGQDSCRIEIAIADNKCHEVCFSMSTWKLLLQQESQILRRFRLVAPLSYQDPIVIDHLRIDFTRINSEQIAKISDNSSVIYMSEPTIIQMCKYAQCIDYMFSSLSEILYSVSNKYASFVDIIRAAATATEDYEKIITESDCYEPNSLIDCEVLALGLGLIVRDAYKTSK